MKKRFFMLFTFLVMFTMMVFGQDGGLFDIDLNTVFASMAGVAAGSVFISALLIKWFKVEKAWLKQLVSWIAPIVLFVVGNLLNFGFMAEFSWLMTFAYGLGAALISNGIFDIAIVQAILAALNLEKKETE